MDKSKAKNWVHDLKSSMAVLETCYRDSEAKDTVKKMFRSALDQIENVAAQMERAVNTEESRKGGDVHA